MDLPKALSVLWKLLKDKNISHQDKLNLAFEFDKVLGLSLKENSKFTIPSEIKKLADEREKARQEKNFKLSDELREKINKKGFLIEDTKTGQKIRPTR